MRYVILAGEPGSLRVIRDFACIHQAATMAESFHQKNNVATTQVWDNERNRLAVEQIDQHRSQICRWRRERGTIGEHLGALA